MQVVRAAQQGVAGAICAGSLHVQSFCLARCSLGIASFSIHESRVLHFNILETDACGIVSLKFINGFLKMPSQTFYSSHSFSNFLCVIGLVHLGLNPDMAVCYHLTLVKLFNLSAPSLPTSIKWV